MDMSNHPQAPADAGDARARIVASLHHRAGDADPQAAIASPNLPALASADPDDRARAPQTEFTRERQVVFLENLSVTGSVRSAASSAGISHQTAYRARRGQGAFRTAWEAALVVARANAEGVLAARAIDGVEEQVFYHGEVVATRTRYSDRLLLAHLARLDRQAADPRTDAFAQDWDGAVARFAAGEGDPAPVCADCGSALPMGAPEGGDTGDGAGGFSVPGPCNTCNTRNTTRAPAKAVQTPRPPIENPCPDCGGRCLHEDAELTRKDCMWLGNRINRMDAARPDRVRLPHQFPGHDSEDVAAEQLWAFEEGVDNWWLVIPPPDGAPDGEGAEWHFAEEQ